MKAAVYPGTFDPVTNGHLDIIERAAKLFDKVIIGVTTHPKKHPLFSLEERIAMVSENVKDLHNVEVKSFDGLLVEFAEEEKAVAIVRGLREISDFAEEFKLATLNRRLNHKIETVHIMTNEKYFYLSSGSVREIAGFKGKVSDFVPASVEKRLKEKFK